MKLSFFTPVFLLGSAAASPLPSSKHENLVKRQVPQEHSHDFVLTITREFLNLDNPQNIKDVVFGLLGNAAAADGAGDVKDLDCLKQQTADTAFTNAKAKRDLRGMAGALLFQAIERNSAGVGVASALCSQKAANPEVGALTQHQDAASENAGALNKAITLELARQLARIGADPNLALLSGTFAPGEVDDPTAAGNSCDDEEPDLGCIYSQGLLVLDASRQEVSKAAAEVSQTFTGTGGIFATDLVDLGSFSTASVAGSVDLATIVNGASGSGNAGNGGAVQTDAPAAPEDDDSVECEAEPPADQPTDAPAAQASLCSVITTTVAAEATAGAGVGGAVAPAETVTSDSNLQTFTGDLGGPAPPVEPGSGNRPFSVKGATFTTQDAAIARSCDIQHNACFNAFNSGELSGDTQQCEQQVADCKAAASLRKRQARQFGSCSDPSVVFAPGLDGRSEESFAPANSADFDHGSALKIGVITDFICQRLADACKAGADAVSKCNDASTMAQAATQDQSAADTFNRALEVGAGDDPSSTNGGGATPAASSVVMTITQCS